VGKIARNRVRDASVRGALEAAGWRVETVWECELKDTPALEARARGWLKTLLPLREKVSPEATDEGCADTVSVLPASHGRRR
jgi:G:T-mismatch repair DNA endonuclease (very short patch repair protein)